MKISHLLETLVSGDAALQFGLHHRLINLSELARFLEPALRSREVKTSHASLVMALSRYQKQLSPKMRKREEAFRFSGIKRRDGLALLTIPRTPSTQRTITQILGELESTQEYFNVTAGDTEYALVLPLASHNRYSRALRLSASEPIVEVSALIVKFNRAYIPRPGFLYLILQQLALQKITILELASTATEFILFLKPADVALAEEQLMRRFHTIRARRQKRNS